MTSQRTRTAEDSTGTESSESESDINLGDDSTTAAGIYEWESDTMIFAHVIPKEQRDSGGTREKFLVLYARPESIEQLSQYPSEIVSLWICSVGHPVEQVREITSWTSTESNRSSRLVLRCESGRMWGVDAAGARYLKPSSAVWAQS